MRFSAQALGKQESLAVGFDIAVDGEEGLDALSNLSAEVFLGSPLEVEYKKLSAVRQKIAQAWAREALAAVIQLSSAPRRRAAFDSKSLHQP